MEKCPCRICRRWFIPNPRLGERQKTCAGPHCKKEWHRKKCAQWNRKNTEYFRANYLQKKLDALAERKGVAGISAVRSRSSSGLPQRKVQEVMGVQPLVILEYWSNYF